MTTGDDEAAGKFICNVLPEDTIAMTQNSFLCNAFPEVLQDYLKVNGKSNRLSNNSAELKEIFENIDRYKLKQDELQIQFTKKLGEGAFCAVYPVHIRNNKTMQFNTNLPPFALKQLSLGVTDNPQVLNAAYSDIIHEAKMLRDIQHENIISLIGMADESEGTTNKKDYFIITEMLESTLESKLEKWIKIRKPMQKFTPNDVVGMRIKNVAIPMASALGFLHSRGILYRDLKPGNVGFDEAGNLKIFDFGLAIKLPKGQKARGMAGTLRYMAPEMKKDPKLYTFSVDVYSYSLLLWEIITSRIALKELQSTAFSIATIPDDKRPNLKYVESKELCSLLENSWTINPDERWNFDRIMLELKRIEIHLAKNASPKKDKSSKGRRTFLSSFR